MEKTRPQISPDFQDYLKYTLAPACLPAASVSWNPFSRLRRSPMPRKVLPGNYYVFDRFRPDFEIGMQISRNAALFRVRSGADVYTPASSDAMSLAKDVHPGRAGWEAASRGQTEFQVNLKLGLTPRS
jgi:hypothetical protein